jgi:hypothetical protein
MRKRQIITAVGKLFAEDGFERFSTRRSLSRKPSRFINRDRNLAVPQYFDRI